LSADRAMRRVPALLGFPALSLLASSRNGQLSVPTGISFPQPSSAQSTDGALQLARPGRGLCLQASLLRSNSLHGADSVSCPGRAIYDTTRVGRGAWRRSDACLCSADQACLEICVACPWCKLSALPSQFMKTGAPTPRATSSTTPTTSLVRPSLRVTAVFYIATGFDGES